MKRMQTERAAWFGAGLSAAAAGLAGYQLVVSSFGSGAWPGPQPEALAGTPTRTPFPTRSPFPTRTPFPSRTPLATRTALPTRTPMPPRTPTPLPDDLGTIALADPALVVAQVATLSAHVSHVLASLEPTPRPR